MSAFCFFAFSFKVKHYMTETNCKKESNIQRIFCTYLYTIQYEKNRKYILYIK